MAVADTDVTRRDVEVTPHWDHRSIPRPNPRRAMAVAGIDVTRCDVEGYAIRFMFCCRK
jgi:hypothetical protein